MNNLYLVLLSIIIVLYVVNIVRKKKFSIEESFWWFMASILMLILVIFSYFIDWFVKLTRIFYPLSLVFVFCIIFLLFINFRDCKRFLS